MTDRTKYFVDSVVGNTKTFVVKPGEAWEIASVVATITTTVTVGNRTPPRLTILGPDAVPLYTVDGGQSVAASQTDVDFGLFTQDSAGSPQMTWTDGILPSGSTITVFDPADIDSADTLTVRLTVKVYRG